MNYSAAQSCGSLITPISAQNGLDRQGSLRHWPFYCIYRGSIGARWKLYPPLVKLLYLRDDRVVLTSTVTLPFGQAAPGNEQLTKIQVRC